MTVDHIALAIWSSWMSNETQPLDTKLWPDNTAGSVDACRQRCSVPLSSIPMGTYRANVPQITKQIGLTFLLLIIDACADPPGKLRSLTLIHQTFTSLSLASPNQIPHTVLFGRRKFSPHMQQMESGSNTTKHKRKKCIATAFRWIIVRVLSVFEVG